MAEASVGADGVAALVLAATIVHGALIDVGEEHGRESRTLHGLVRMELHTQRIAVRGSCGRDGTATEGANPLETILGELGVNRNRIVATIGLLMCSALQIEMREIQ